MAYPVLSISDYTKNRGTTSLPALTLVSVPCTGRAAASMIQNV